MVLLINACARPGSRTLPLAKKAAEKLSSDVQTLDLYAEGLAPLSNTELEKRDSFIADNDYSEDMFRFAKQFKSADCIVIAAPYWDMSFPAALKCYIEAICVNGLTFRYTEQGVPEGLCRAERLVYVTTAGGYIPENNSGYDYIRCLCAELFGIRQTVCVKAEGLDILGADIESILSAAEDEIDNLL